MLTIAQVARHLERLAPLPYQESYDNAGLLTGDPQAQVTGILLTLDATEAVVDEALAKGCNLVVAHHPIVFSGLKKITGRTYVERVVIKAIKNNVALYAIHTNLDNVLAGVNAQVCRQLGLVQPKILSPKRGLLKKLTVFVPTDHTGALLDVLTGAGAGQIGNYSHCSFSVAGEGTFRPNDLANPFLGQAGQLERVSENRIEVVFPGHLEGAVLAAMRQAHPYEEVAYYVHLLENANQTIERKEILHRFSLQVVRHTPLLGREVRRVAVCGGAGSFLLAQAIGAKADFFVTADYKYHQFFDADGQIVIADIGHYESEVGTKELLRDQLQAHLPAGLLHLSGVNTNPVHYFLG